MFAVLLWWLSTGVILLLNGMRPQTFKWTMLASSIVLGLALYGLHISSQTNSVWSAYCAFTCAVLVWAWQEIGFLLGYVTGVRKVACPPHSSGIERWRYGLQAVSHHELALVVLFAAVWWASASAPNQVGFWTYVILWAMRQSAKLNVFLGVRNLSESFLPAHLKYLQSYFSRRPMNALLPVSVVASGWFAVLLWQSVFAVSATAFEITAASLLATLLSLAIVEHFFLVLPIRFEWLWKWGLRSRPVH